MDFIFKDNSIVYFVGIKGVAMAALAIYCKERGMKVSGSDVSEEFPTDEALKKAKILIHEGFTNDHIENHRPDVVIFTGAHNGKDNPEVKIAISLGIPAIPHGMALGMIMETYHQVVVGGSHGKTTVTAMIATIVSAAKKDPSYAIGCGGITALGPAGHFGKGGWFIAEGDEYITDPGHDTTPRFLWMKPEIFVVTNIDFDHPDAYTDLSAVQDAFKKVQQQQRDHKLTVVNIDDEPSSVLLNGPNVMTYGFSPKADTRITHVEGGKERMFFTLEQKGVRLCDFSIQVPGRHNVLNATAAVVAAMGMGIKIEEIRSGLLAFKGTKRRFEKLAVIDTVTYYDDYAHHPAEIKATLSAAHTWFPDGPVIAVFQPHTYSRTKALFADFSRAFAGADAVLLSDIYSSARETESHGLTGESLFVEIEKNHKNVLYTRGPDEIIAALKTFQLSGGVVLFMGAGSIFSWEDDIIKALKSN